MNDTGFVPFPNEIIDQVMPELSANGWKVFCFVWRKTQGWRKRKDKIAYSQLYAGTGIKHNVTLKKAIEEIAGIVTVTPGVGRTNTYEFDVSEWFIDDTVKVSENDTLPVKVSENEPIKPIKVSLSAVKVSENDNTTDTIQQTQSITTTTTPPENLKIINTEQEAQTALRALTTNYEDSISVSISPLLADEFKDYSWQVKPEWVVNAYKATVSANVQSWNYPRKILDECIKAGSWAEKKTNPQRTNNNGKHKGNNETDVIRADPEEHAKAVRSALAARQRATV